MIKEPMQRTTKKIQKSGLSHLQLLQLPKELPRLFIMAYTMPLAGLMLIKKAGQCVWTQTILFNAKESSCD